MFYPRDIPLLFHLSSLQGRNDLQAFEAPAICAGDPINHELLKAAEIEAEARKSLKKKYPDRVTDEEIVQADYRVQCIKSDSLSVLYPLNGAPQWFNAFERRLEARLTTFDRRFTSLEARVTAIDRRLTRFARQFEQSTINSEKRAVARSYNNQIVRNDTLIHELVNNEGHACRQFPRTIDELLELTEPRISNILRFYDQPAEEGDENEKRRRLSDFFGLIRVNM